MAQTGKAASPRFPSATQSIPNRRICSGRIIRLIACHRITEAATGNRLDVVFNGNAGCPITSIWIVKLKGNALELRSQGNVHP